MPDPGGRWAIMVHGGAKKVAPEQAQAHRDGVLRALEAGRQVLARGGSALDAVEFAVRALEADPVFNAGLGSALTARGEVEMDAAVMDGWDLNLGAVAAVQGVRHPVSVARALLPDPAVLLVAEGARTFAAEQGLELCDPSELIPPGARPPHAAHDTVGCVALDASGHVASATSTGGLSGTRPGRVGDSPLPGCGLYADDTVGAVALSGDGELIARTMLAARVMGFLPRETPQEALAQALELMRTRVGGEAGGIVLNPDGELGWAHTSEHFPVAYITADMDAPRAFLGRQETP
ncbi:beta-aspartyl-peptidase (threonine type) [Deinobacterium chartae]|uniref:Beta-aspartyl-peptidase (Threonine type) n=1 Tax=Deinobacterium chartae TaxID=521158 RepID=A0A841HX01_9DEIO|nr:isoaspartyl peptidase/L-asparaginase family protein [Deinobacterium chartae]MBB6097383.1 beta-aspartyl-peptidase (threonine type) [Deinobacterium chartae]